MSKRISKHGLQAFYKKKGLTTKILKERKSLPGLKIMFDQQI